MKKFLLLSNVFLIFVIHAEVKIEDCASIESDVKRLACYDYLVTGISKTSNELEEVSKENQGTSAETIDSGSSNFGLSKKKIEESGAVVTKNSLASSISSISKTFGGKTRFKLSNNQLWESQAVLSSIKSNNFRTKNQVIIEEANMGGFWMINRVSNVKIKVKRIS